VKESNGSLLKVLEVDNGAVLTEQRAQVVLRLCGTTNRNHLLPALHFNVNNNNSTASSY